MVPGRFDVVIDGHGYVFWNALMQSLPFRNQRAAYSYTPTFIERTNTSGNYGDNQQDFFLTASQNDWSEGEQQRFFRSGNADSVRKYWAGSNIDVSTQGQVSLRPAVKTLTFSSAAVGGCGTSYTNNKLYYADSTHLYSIDGSGSVTDLGAHGAGAPFPRAITTDKNSVYVGGATKIRRYDILGASFADFSSTTAMALTYSGNILYGIPSTMGVLIEYDTTGAFTQLYPWNGAEGSAVGVISNVRGFGGNVAILRYAAEDQGGAELWEWDGSSAHKTGQFPGNLYVDGIEVSTGIMYITGAFRSKNATYFESAVYYYVNGTLDLLWRSRNPSTNLAVPAICAFNNGVVWTDETAGTYVFYDPSNGSFSTLGSFTGGSLSISNVASGLMFAGGTQFAHTRNSTTGYFFPDTTTASSGYIQTSLFDFDNSLTKLFRGIKVDFTPGSDGDGGSVDIAYQIDSLDGAYTSLFSPAVSGTEYIVGTTGHSISVKITLHKGTSTFGPVLKRIYVRAAPVQQSFRRCQYVLDLTGSFTGDQSRNNPVPLRDGTYSTLTGNQMAANLVGAITSTTPIQVYDRFGGYTAVFEQGEGITELDEVRPGEFIAQVTTREV